MGLILNICIWLAYNVILRYNLFVLCNEWKQFGPYGKDISEVFLNSTSTQEFLNSLDSQSKKLLVYEQFRHCPSTSVCSFNTPTVDPDSCCWASCKCDFNCHYYHDCCPDIVSSDNKVVTDKQTITDTGEVCTPTSYKPVTEKGVYGKQTCPESSLQESIKKCQGTTVNTKKELDIIDIVPVTDVTDYVTYKNKYCAFCNNVSPNSLEYWIPKLYCTSQESVINMVPGTSLKSFVKKKKNKCNIIYEPGRIAVKNSRSCFLTESKCNSTGLWKKYNEFDEWACSAYTSPVIAENSKVYKNIFCAVCNGFDGIHALCRFIKGTDPGSKSFTALLSMSVGPAVGAFIGCTKGYMLNPITSVKDRLQMCSNPALTVTAHPMQDDCIKAECSLIRSLTKNDCEQIIPNVDGFSYVMSLRIFPLSKISLAEGYSLLADLTGWITTHLLSSTYKLNKLEIGLVRLFIITHQGKSDPLLDIHYYDMSVSLRYMSQHNPEDLLDSFIETRNNRLFLLLGKFQFVSYVLDDSGNATAIALRKVKRNKNKPDCISLDLPRPGFSNKTVEELLLYSWVNQNTKERKTPILDYVCSLSKIHRSLEFDKVMPILALHRCPKVRVLRNDMAWMENAKGVTFISNNISLNLSDYRYKDNNMDTLIVCADVYFKLQGWLGITSQERKQDIMLPLLLVALMFPFFIKHIL